MAGPRPNSNGPKRGERVGGVCPDVVLLAVSRDRRVSSVIMVGWSGVGKPGSRVTKWAGGYPRAKKVGGKTRQQVTVENGRKLRISHRRQTSHDKIMHGV